MLFSHGLILKSGKLGKVGIARLVSLGSSPLSTRMPKNVQTSLTLPALSHMLDTSFHESLGPPKFESITFVDILKLPQTCSHQKNFRFQLTFMC